MSTPDSREYPSEADNAPSVDQSPPAPVVVQGPRVDIPDITAGVGSTVQSESSPPLVPSVKRLRNTPGKRKSSVAPTVPIVSPYSSALVSREPAPTHSVNSIAAEADSSTNRSPQPTDATDRPSSPIADTTAPAHVVSALSSLDGVESPGPLVTIERPERLSVKTTDTPPPEAILTPSAAAPAPISPPLHVVMLTPELAPIAKVGGLGDVVSGLSSELERRGHTVEIILPKYDCMRYDQIRELHRCYDDLFVPWFKGGIHCSVSTGTVHGRVCYFIEPHSNENFFNRGCIYGNNDDVMRFVFFCKAALEFLLKSGKRPDIIHSHDWPTGIASVLLYEIYAAAGMNRTRACYTIHNFKHQGGVGDQVLWATGLGRPRDFFRHDRMLDNNNSRVLNLMKAGIVYSNFVTTVSPHYAWDARFTDQGFGMQSTINTHHAKYGGVLNGLDYEYWNPRTDPFVPFHYSSDTIEEKYHNKRALRERLGLADGDKPIVSFVGRLDPQKGLDLIRHALFHCLGNKAQFVLLGNSPDAKINGAFHDVKRRLDRNPDCRLEIAFNEELSHLVYAGSDMVIVPSLYEPCGLTQIIGLRYGTVPIVRAVGGLVDTVFDKDYSDKPAHLRNGYVFNDANTTAVDWALNRAISCYYKYPSDFRTLMLNGMKCDFSWESPGGHYVDIYNSIRCR